MATTAELLESMLTLPQKERAALALHLLESLDEEGETRSVDEDDDALATEVARRLDEIQTGKVVPIDGREALAAIRARLHR